MYCLDFEKFIKVMPRTKSADKSDGVEDGEGVKGD